MQVDYKKVGKNYHFFQLMILYGEMVFWYRMWEMGIQGKLQHVIRNI